MSLLAFIFIACTPTLHHGVCPKEMIVSQGMHPHPGPKAALEDLEEDEHFEEGEQREKDERTKHLKRKLKDEISEGLKLLRKSLLQASRLRGVEDADAHMQRKMSILPFHASSYLLLPFANGKQLKQIIDSGAEDNGDDDDDDNGDDDDDKRHAPNLDEGQVEVQASATGKAERHDKRERSRKSGSGSDVPERKVFKKHPLQSKNPPSPERPNKPTPQKKTRNG